MPEDSAESPDVTTLLKRWSGGDRAALDQLMPLVYAELRRIASDRLRRENPGHTLQSAALVNEAFLKLVNQKGIEWQNRAHFFGVAARAIRQILVDHARAQNRAKRGGGADTVVFDENIAGGTQHQFEVIALDDVLNALERISPQQSRIVELRFFAGLTAEETAEALQVSRSTVNRDWASARAWLLRELARRGRADAAAG